MPPETREIPRPTTWGHDAREWLEAHGLVARTPPIRASDFQTALADPFGYYLTRRLGLTDRLGFSEALSHGSWFHERLFVWHLPVNAAVEHLTLKLEQRFRELDEIAEAHGILPDQLRTLKEREEKSMAEAVSWVEAYRTVRRFGPGQALTLEQWMGQAWMRDLGGEILFRVPGPRGTTRVVQVDRLLYHEQQNSLWIVDWKTCREETTTRLLLCPIEFQTQHYMMVLKELIENGTVQDEWNLPDDVRLGGMVHVAFQKPGIRMGLMDRPFEEYEHELKTGPRRGQVEIRRRYVGDPTDENYLRRCQRWIRSEGEYEELAPQRVEHPTVNQSVVPGAFTEDEDWVDQYERRLALLTDLATIDPLPRNFIRSARTPVAYGKESPLAPFYLSSPANWPDLVREGRFVQTWREGEVEQDDRAIVRTED